MKKEYADFTYGMKFVMLDEDWYNGLVAANNPKKNYYKPVMTADVPDFDAATQKIEETITVTSSFVFRGWNVVNKTAEEIALENNKTYTSYEFLLRFTESERAAIRLAAATDVTSVTADFLQLSQAAQEINTMDPVTIAGMDYLVSIGLLTQQRRDQIMA